MPGIFYSSGDEGSAPPEKSKSVAKPKEGDFMSGSDSPPYPDMPNENDGDQSYPLKNMGDLHGEPDQRHKG